MASSSWSVFPLSTPKLLRKSRIDGDEWGLSTYALYEGAPAQQGQAKPYLFVWLHGVDGCGELGTPDMAGIQKRMGHRTYFLVPQNPKKNPMGRVFHWGVSATKAQNKDDLGYIFGEICEAYLTALTQVIRDVVAETQPCRTILAGYSMGGYGAYLIGGYAPRLFDAIISVAGYCMGTTETSDAGTIVPQPQSLNVFKGFLARFSPKLAEIPLVVALHAPVDKVSSYKDTAMIIATVKSFGGNTKLISVPENLANSDLSARVKNRRGHHYLKACLWGETSDALFYNMFRDELERRGAGAKASVARPSPSSSSNPPTKRAAPVASIQQTGPRKPAATVASLQPTASSLIKLAAPKQKAAATAGRAATVQPSASSLIKLAAPKHHAAATASSVSSRPAMPSQQRTGQYAVPTAPGKRLCASLGGSAPGKSLQTSATATSSSNAGGVSVSPGKSPFGNAKAAARIGTIKPSSAPSIRPSIAPRVAVRPALHAGVIRPKKWNN